MSLPKTIRISGIPNGHVQGIATDRDRKYMYYSFTTCLIKTDMEGRLIGSVKGLAGHLGCIAYNYDDGRVYGSLEFKHDSIGAAILKRISADGSVDVTDGFYAVAFDVDKITRMDMDAEQDGIMTAVYLKEVFDDYSASEHRYGCSGIDGFTFAPLPGSKEEKKYLYVAYGIYTDLERKDNDHQVILRYDISNWADYEAPLNQSNMHHRGPEKADSKYFVYTGNTHYGIQNLEYDPVTTCLFAAVYKGRKPQFPNYPMYIIDLNKNSAVSALAGLEEQGEIMQLADFGLLDEDSGIRGLNFPYGSTGMISLGDGSFYFSRDFKDDSGWGTEIGLYRFDGTNFIE
ncbi:MAG: hypothetical protein IJ411_04045 [Oscillospiraceae bacterium]|nr:hypothetical protein [Oscillospiraceae bacterium]